MAIPNTIALPFGIEFSTWVALLIAAFPEDNIPVAYPVKNWWGWVEVLIQLPKFRDAPIPDKKVYKTEEAWREWAIYFIQLYNS